MLKNLLLQTVGVFFIVSGAFSMTSQTINDGRDREATIEDKYQDRYVKEVFDEADVNHDGFVSWAEAKDASLMIERDLFGRKRFHAADTNNDDVLSIEEVRVYREKESAIARSADVKVARRQARDHVAVVDGPEAVADEGSPSGIVIQRHPAVAEETGPGGPVAVQGRANVADEGSSARPVTVNAASDQPTASAGTATSVQPSTSNRPMASTVRATSDQPTASVNAASDRPTVSGPTAAADAHRRAMKMKHLERLQAKRLHRLAR